MPTFEFRFRVPAPLSVVRRFHHDTSALKKLTPPPVFVQLHEIEPLSEGSVSRFTLWMGPLPLCIAAGFFGAFVLVYLAYSRIFPTLAVPDDS